MKPVADKLIIRPTSIDRKTSSGVIVAHDTNDATAYGEVIAVGPGRITDNNDLILPRIKVGDKVVYIIHYALKTSATGEELHIVQEEHIQAIL